jgi:hypothetical protein
MGKVSTVLVPLAVVLVGAIACTAGAWFWTRGREFRSRGVTAKAVVLRKYRKSDELPLENFYARVSFTDTRQRPHEVDVKLHSRAWRSVSEGETTPITYLEDDPENVLGGPRVGRQIVGAFLLFFVAVSAGLTVFALIELFKALFVRTAAPGG